MTRYVLDTDILTLLRRQHATVLQHVNAHPPADLAITVITVEEQLSGWYTQVRRAKRKDALAQAYQNLTETAAFLGKLQILSFTESAIDRYEQLKLLKLTIGKKDLRIAAITQENGSIL